MNNKTSRRSKLIRKDIKQRMEQTSEKFATAQRNIVLQGSMRVTDGGTNHNGGAGNTRFAYKGI